MVELIVVSAPPTGHQQVIAKPRKSLEPWVKDEVEYYPHQITGVRELFPRSGWLLADEMGLGKSLQAITVFAACFVKGYVNSAIVICPTTLKENWADELRKFTRMNFIVVTGTPAKRREQIEEFRKLDGPKFLIMNYEQISPHLDQLNTLNLSVGMFDEAHYLKNHSAKRTQACLKLRLRAAYLLTGTPMLNRPNELWALMHRISPREFPSYWKWTHHFCIFGGFNNKEIIGVKNEKELHQVLNKYMLRRLKKDVLNLPEVQVIERRVDLSPKQREVYNQIISELKVEMEGETSDIENSLTKFLRLKQVCGTLLPFTGEDESAKLDLALEDDLEILANDHKIVVFTQFRSVHRAYVNRLKAAGVKEVFELTGDTPITQRTEVVKTWGSTPGPAVIVCMLQVAGVGLNMTAASHCSFLDKLFVPGLNQQAVDRLHRIGATGESIQVREYLCRNTVETRVNQILAIKNRLGQQVIEDAQQTINFKKLLIQALQEELM